MTDTGNPQWEHDLLMLAREHATEVQRIMENLGYGCYDDTYQMVREAKTNLGNKIAGIREAWASEQVAASTVTTTRCSLIGITPLEL